MIRDGFNFSLSPWSPPVRALDILRLKPKIPTPMTTEEIICECGVLSPRGETVYLVTVLIPDAARGQATCEQHVFRVAHEAHLHAITYRYLSADHDSLRAEAVGGTRRLLSERMQWEDAPLTPVHPRLVSTQFTPLEDEPFHHFHLAGKFRAELDEIEGWTASVKLRALLATLRTHRCDLTEKSFLARLFDAEPAVLAGQLAAMPGEYGALGTA